jgi:hypothetical protein
LSRHIYDILDAIRTTPKHNFLLTEFVNRGTVIRISAVALPQ